MLLGGSCLAVLLASANQDDSRNTAYAEERPGGGLRNSLRREGNALEDSTAVTGGCGQFSEGIEPAVGIDAGRREIIGNRVETIGIVIPGREGNCVEADRTIAVGFAGNGLETGFTRAGEAGCVVGIINNGLIVGSIHKEVCGGERVGQAP